MTLASKKILKELRKISGNTEQSLCLLGNTTCLSLSNCKGETYDYSRYQNEINSIIKQLVDLKYLEYGQNEDFFSLTQYGLHPYQYKWDVLKMFLLKSVAVPIFVAFVTALLTSHLVK